MNPQDLSALTVYNDLVTILQEQGFSDAEVSEMILKLTAQAEVEVVEELMKNLTETQLQDLDSLGADANPLEISQKLGFDPEELEAIRAQKTAQLIEQLVPTLNQGTVK